MPHEAVSSRPGEGKSVRTSWSDSEHKTSEGRLYCCAVKDVFSSRIVGYLNNSRIKSRLAVQALEDAALMRGDVAGCVVHSDRESQF
ncbi:MULTISPECIES: DDE-type integrase/transposase/recombinase [unclassified Leucobacter]|uniref:DDE-type integrase/transposase/recombinase n=1 Tax=Leucobacter sp. OAMSW11 TaxID=1933287 RepID=UPI00117B21C5